MDEVTDERDDNDYMTDDERTMRERMAHPLAAGGKCDHPDLNYVADGHGYVVCNHCLVEFVEADYVIEAMGRIEQSQLTVETTVRNILAVAGVGAKQLAASPLGAMLGIDGDGFNAEEAIKALTGG